MAADICRWLLLLPATVRRDSVRDCKKRVWKRRPREVKSPAQSHQFLSPLLPIRGPSLAPSAYPPSAPRPLTSRSQRDRQCSREPWALMGPGRRWGDIQRETRSHLGLGGGCWLSQRPSWGRSLSSSGEGTRPVESVLREEANSGVGSPLLPSVSRSLMTLSSHWLVRFNVTAESQQDGAGITLCGEKNPLDAE